MRLEGSGFSIFGLCALAQLAPSSARACGAVTSCRALSELVPADRAAEVARNVELHVGYTHENNAVEHPPAPILMNDADEVVAVTWERANGVHEHWMGRPAQPLAPRATYHLHHAYTECTSGSEACELCASPSGASRAFASFTTGEQLVTSTLEAPALPAVVSLGFESEAVACRGTYARCLHQLDLPELPKGQWFRASAGDRVVLPRSRGGADDVVFVSYLANSLRAAGGSSLTQVAPSAWLPTGGGTYELYVVDAAGNRGPGTEVNVPADCSPPDGGVPVVTYPDAGTPPPVVDASSPSVADSGVAPPADVSEPERSASSDSCALAGSSSRGALGAHLLGLLALLWGRRRASARSSRS